MNGTIDRDPAVLISPRRRVSWGAIWAGMFVTVIMQIMLVLLGIACGIATLNPASNPPSAPTGLSIAAAIWMMVSWLVSVWVGARVAGWMCGGPRAADGMVHGVVVWSFSAAVILLLTTGAVGTLVGASGGLLGGSSAKNNNILAMGQEQSSAVLPPASGPQTATTLSPTGPTGNQQPYQYQNQQNGGSTAKSNARAAIWGGALWSFIALILGLAVAAWGGSTGVAPGDRVTVPPPPAVA